MLKGMAIKALTTLLGASLASSGLAYAGVPGVPNPVKAVVEAASGGPDTQQGPEGELPQQAEDGQLTAEEKKQAAKEYTDDMRAWSDCVAGNAEAQGDDETRQEGEFDPAAECGERPDPSDYGLTEVPDQAADEGAENSDSGPGSASEHEPTDVPDADGNPSSNAPDGQPEDVPDGQPADAPTGGS